MRVRQWVRRVRRLTESNSAVSARMRRDWDARARENARYYAATLQENWSDTEFFESGRIWFRQYVLPDIELISGRRSADQLRMLEIGCGAGRMTRVFAEVFGSVDAVDISPAMIEEARASLRDLHNVHFHTNNGVDLSGFGDCEYDFAFSAIVFQHIPRKSIVRNYVKETSRVLRPGGVFSFQVLGIPINKDYVNTWVGVGFRADEIRTIAKESGLRIHSESGVGTQYHWLTCVKA